jgi:hypothetical protein
MSAGIIAGNVFGAYLVSITIDPASVAAATTAEQTFTLSGLKTSDVVFVRKPTLTAGLGIAGARCSAADTLAITFINATASPIDAASEVYSVAIFRPEGGAVAAAIGG